jgi:hypothetical protein
MNSVSSVGTSLPYQVNEDRECTGLTPCVAFPVENHCEEELYLQCLTSREEIFDKTENTRSGSTAQKSQRLSQTHRCI